MLVTPPPRTTPLGVPWERVCNTCFENLDSGMLYRFKRVKWPHVDYCAGCVRTLGMSRVDTFTAPHAAHPTGPEHYRADYACARCGHEWFTTWGKDHRLTWNAAAEHAIQFHSARRETALRQAEEEALEAAFAAKSTDGLATLTLGEAREIMHRARLHHTHTGEDMRPHVRIEKAGDSYRTVTNCGTEEEFIREAAKGVDEAMVLLDTGEREFALRQLIPQITDICCAMRGYKAPLVEVQRVLTAGSSVGLSGEVLVDTTRPDIGIDRQETAVA